MKNKRRLAAALLAALLLLSGGQVYAAPASEAQTMFSGIAAARQRQAGAADTQAWIDGALTAQAGQGAEWYVLALSQSGDYNFARYEEALRAYLADHTVSSAASRQKYALVLMAVGSDSPYIAETMENSIGQQGVMSWIFGLHLLNNGDSSAAYTREEATAALLSRQHGDGSWAVTGTAGDVDVTAMAVQALAAQAGEQPEVTAAVGAAVAWLSARQQPDGGYQSYGVSNPESAAQVLTALSALGIDSCADSRFMPNGNTLLDALAAYRLEDGTFCHRAGGASNENATVQVFYALAAYQRLMRGQAGLYLLDAVAVPSASSAAVTAGTAGAALPAADAATGTAAAGTAASATTTLTTTAAATGTGTQTAVTTAATAITTAMASAPTGSITLTGAAPAQADTPDGGGTGGSSHGGYKVWVSAAVVLLAAGVCVVLLRCKKGRWQNFLLVGAAAAVLLAVVWGTTVQTPQQYAEETVRAPARTVGQVTLSIRCDTVAGREAYLPADGVILEGVSLPIEEGETVYDLLCAAAAQNSLALVCSGQGGGVYVESIAHLREQAFGDLSGWMYFVNGEEPSVSCGAYTLQDGDEVVWRYTCALGEDLRGE